MKKRMSFIDWDEVFDDPAKTDFSYREISAASDFDT